VIVEGLPLPAMPFILVAIPQKITVELKENILGDAQVLPRGLNRIHDVGIACHLLFIARLKGLLPEIANERFDLTITELRPLNSSR